MKRLCRTIIISLVALFAAGVALSAQSIEGYWTGTIVVGGQSLELCFDITPELAGGYSVTMDVPRQGARHIPTSSFSFDGMKVSIGIDAIKATYEGVMFMKTISGTFRQSGMDLTLVLTPGQRPALNRPQNPQGPFPYSQEEVCFVNEQAGIKLAGTLTLPEGEGPFTAVVLVTGSGKQNRDEEMMGHRPFAVIADYLTRQGVAVLRYDDRGMGDSQAGTVFDTTVDFADDAYAAVDFLRSRGQFSRIGVLGHSEGGVIAYMLGARKAVDFIVSLAGPAMKGSEVLLTQQYAINDASGMTLEALQENEALFRKIFDAIEQSESATEAEPAIRGALSGMPEESQLTILRQVLSSWMYAFARFDPSEYVAAVTCPALVLNGSKDLQVLAGPNLAALRSLAGDNFQIVELDGLNHFFQHCEKGLPAEYELIEETISPEVLQLVAEFVLRLDN